MDKKLQDLAWSCLPKEFKEEVKRMYRIADSDVDQMIATIMLENVFGLHNLTSDAEEDDEILCASRKEVQKIYKKSKHIISNEVYGSKMYSMHLQILCVLENLFGSKCLPDEEPKPAEPKYKVGDIVRFKYGCTPYRIDGFKMSEGAMLYQVGEVWAAASDIEPYTEPEEPTCTDTCTDDCLSQSRNLSQETANCDKCNDRRLHIAAMVMQGLLASPVDANMQSKSVDYIVKASFEYADALIAEAEKGGAVGNS